MSLQQLLFLVLFATLFQSSISNPIVARAKDDPDHWVEHYEKVFAGIYWKEAWETCSEREFFLLADTVSSVTEWIDPSQNGGVEDRDTPGWTRFFAGRSVSYSWTHKKLGSPKAYENIIFALEQVRNFPIKGKAGRKKGSVSKGSRITFTCKEPEKNKGHCAKTNAGATTVQPRERGELTHANLIFFCPPFLDDYDTNKSPPSTRGTRWSLHHRTFDVKTKNTGIAELETLVTKEHIMLHEFFHCNNLLKIPVPIVDLKDITLPDGEKLPSVYGAARCAKLAWANIKFAKTADLTKINPLVSENADNYAWMFTFNWFKRNWGWSTDGTYHWDDNTKRDGSGSDSDEAFNVDGDDSLTGSTGMSVEEINDSPSLPNCQQVGDDAADVQCAYVGEDSIEEWSSSHPDFTMTSTPMTAPTVAVISRTITTQATTSAASVSCYHYQNPGVANGCECEGLTGIFAKMSSTSGQTSYEACGWTTTPPLASSTPASTANVTAKDGTISYCTSAVRADADVNDALSCAVTATPIATDSAIASKYSVYLSSKAAAASASATTSSDMSAATTGTPDLEFYFAVLSLKPGMAAGTHYSWNVYTRDNSGGDDVGGSFKWCHSNGADEKLKASSIKTDSFPPTIRFQDLSKGINNKAHDKYLPCVYTGADGGAGTIGCEGWKNQFKCTTDFSEYGKTIDGSSQGCVSAQKAYPRVLCKVWTDAIVKDNDP